MSDLPEESRGDILPIDRLDADAVRAGVAQWRTLKGARRFPSRDVMEAGLLGTFSRNASLVKVVEGGADYEYCVVGDVLVAGFNENFAGRRLSSMIESAPKFGLGLRMLYEMVRASGEPLGYRGWVGKDMTAAAFVYHENAVLPLGQDPPDGAAVDHLLIVSVIVPRHAAGV